MEQYWQLWSKAVENGWLAHLGHTGATKRALSGRGKVKVLTTQAPKRRAERKQEDEFKHLRNPESRKALRNLRQARRCEQYAHRLELACKERANDIHEKLNFEAIKGITKASDESIDWEIDLIQKLGNDPVRSSKNTMLIPVLNKAATKYHQAYDGHKANALKLDEAEKEKIYRIKGKGKWTLANSVGSKTLPPLTAVKRKHKGPNNEPVGSIATAQGEVDTIVREAYDEIDVGNKANQEQATAEYLEQYKIYF